MSKYFVVLVFLMLSVSAFAQRLASEKKVLKLMGTRFEISAVAIDQISAWKAINLAIDEIQRIENLISSWDPNSQTSAINNNAGIRPQQVDKELFDLIYRAKKVAQLTEGAFDISFASMDRIWAFDGSHQIMPEEEKVRMAASKINWENIILNKKDNTVYLKEKGMKIGFGGIGKGYAANRAKMVMQQVDGLKGGVVNASGDLIAWGHSLQPEGWTIKIANPQDRDHAIAWLQIKDMAIVTSGDYEKYVMIDGVRYAHIIDPRSGYPTTGIKSVSILCPDAELADALATSVFVLGVEKGMALINKLNGVEGLIITDTDQLVSSEKLQINYY